MTNKYHEHAARIKKLGEQIDQEKLKTAIVAVNKLGDGSQMFYSQGIDTPYTTAIYITVKLQNNMWSTVVGRHGGLYFPEMSEAMILVADGILRGLE